MVFFKFYLQFSLEKSAFFAFIHTILLTPALSLRHMGIYL